MSSSVKRIELPSGRWWEIEGRPQWKHLREMSCASRRADPGGGKAGEGSLGELVEEALALLTTEWGFEEPVCPASVRNRELADVAAVLAEAEPVVTGMLRTRKERAALAMELFAGLMKGEAPAAFEEVHLMSRTGWTWEQLQETPADVVELMSVYLSVVEAMESGGTVGAEGNGDGD